MLGLCNSDQEDRREVEKLFQCSMSQLGSSCKSLELSRPGSIRAHKLLGSQSGHQLGIYGRVHIRLALLGVREMLQCLCSNRLL